MRRSILGLVLNDYWCIDTYDTSLDFFQYPVFSEGSLGSGDVGFERFYTNTFLGHAHAQASSVTYISLQPAASLLFISSSKPETYSKKHCHWWWNVSWLSKLRSGEPCAENSVHAFITFSKDESPKCLLHKAYICLWVLRRRFLQIARSTFHVRIPKTSTTRLWPGAVRHCSLPQFPCLRSEKSVKKRFDETECSLSRKNKKEVNAIANGVSSAGSGIKYRLSTALLFAYTLLFLPKNTHELLYVPKSIESMRCVLRCLNQNSRRQPYVWAGTRDMLNSCLSVRCSIHIKSFDVLVGKHGSETHTCRCYG